jgi:F-type H+-transporting ATPase subunit gamma
MRRPMDIAKQERSMATIVTLTTAFESLASMRIAQIKTQVLDAQLFFAEIWHIYNQLRVDNLFRFGRQQHDDVIDKALFIAITAEGGFSGDIDQRLIRTMLQDYNPDKHDIIIIGHHGAVQLAQNGVKYKKYFKLPVKDQNTNIRPLVAEVRKYRTTFVYYQKYISLMSQEIVKIELSQSVQEQGKAVVDKGEFISEENYIFEPSTFAVVAHLERSMLDISLGQTILDSKLAQYASRFRAMSAAKDRSKETAHDLHTEYNRSKRMQSDERLKEIINGMKKSLKAEAEAKA